MNERQSHLPLHSCRCLNKGLYALQQLQLSFEKPLSHHKSFNASPLRKRLSSKMPGWLGKPGIGTSTNSNWNSNRATRNGSRMILHVQRNFANSGAVTINHYSASPPSPGRV